MLVLKIYLQFFIWRTGPIELIKRPETDMSRPGI